MNRKRRTEILIKAPGDVLQVLSRQICEKYHVIEIEKPDNGLVMVKIRETAKKRLFYIGEVLVTECKVRINGCPGIGIIKGNQPEKAYRLAVVDAAYNAELEETAQWEAILKQQEELIKHKKQQFDHKVLRTKVDFHTMKIT